MLFQRFGVFALTESSQISDCTFMLRDRENLSGVRRIFAGETILFCTSLQLGVVLESQLLCDSLDSGSVWHKCFCTASPAKNKNTRFSGACLEGENSWLLGVVTAVGAACLKSAVQDSPELAALVRNRLFMNCI